MTADASARVFRPGDWQHLRVGQVIKVLRDQLVPADLIVLKAH